jgi:hypothetical protein
LTPSQSDIFRRRFEEKGRQVQSDNILGDRRGKGCGV